MGRSLEFILRLRTATEAGKGPTWTPVWWHCPLSTSEHHHSCLRSLDSGPPDWLLLSAMCEAAICLRPSPKPFLPPGNPFPLSVEFAPHP